MSLLEQWAAVGLFLLHFHQHHRHQSDELAGHPTTRDNEIKPFEKYNIFVTRGLNLGGGVRSLRASLDRLRTILL